VKAGRTKDSTLKKSKAAKDKSNKSKQKHQEDKAQDAWKEAKNALKELDKLRERVEELLEDSKMGAIAHDNIQSQSDQIELELTVAESQSGKEIQADSFEDVITFDDETINVLVFEFYPNGTEFLVSAELVVPWDEIIYHDVLFWYSEDGELIELIDLDYFIDDENETVIFFINHFSHYYYRR